ncbi:hypothetical protein AAFF_G00142080 [Aldrovandia affinis]|uniref:Uncharacterized protein n=1 Tax=Aldrovandia affinis TaxID=143900 RepID=A0AAD7X4C1_9TELE|nr:hypothetical protein AAFF_G00142080 [Aldrovandia affinis]
MQQPQISLEKDRAQLSPARSVDFTRDKGCLTNSTRDKVGPVSFYRIGITVLLGERQDARQRDVNPERKASGSQCHI